MTGCDDRDMMRGMRTALLLATALVCCVMPAMAQSHPLRIVTLGTSWTSRGTWPAALERALAACTGQPVAVDVVALGGSTSDWARTQVPRVVELKPDVILVETYANDAALQRFVSLTRSQRNFAAIVEGLKQALPSSRIVALGMNPMHGIRGLARPFLDRYRDGHRQIAEREAIEYLDFGPQWAAMTPEQLRRAIPDGSHPDPNVAADLMVPTLVRHLAPGCAD